MKKSLLFTVCYIEIAVLLLFTGCRHSFPFLQEESEIASVEIVSLKYVQTETDMPEELLLCEIENISDFLRDFSRLQIKRKSPPHRSTTFKTPTVIKILYNDGSFEWISPTGKMVHRADGPDVFYGSNYFDGEEFAAFIEKYVGNAPITLDYNFLYRQDNITSVEIVEMGKSEHPSLISEEQTTICKIDDISDFLKRFSEMDCFLNSKEPTKVQDGATVFKIHYGDGQYELIGANGQSKCEFDGDSGKDVQGYRYFNAKQFDDLISYYTDNKH